jgi:TetR/AcrR family transcriptional repressor of nem operon
MRVSRQEMDAGHRRIVEGTARLMRERGVRGTSVADAMKEAELTHGGFYRHFASKDELAAAALRKAFDDFAAPLELRQKLEPPAEVVAEFTALYLSHEHVQHPGIGCPMPALGSEIGREAPELKAEFGAGVRRMIEAFAAGMSGSTTDRRVDALKHLCLLVGAVTLARATDPATATELLGAVRTSLADAAGSG